MTTENEPRDQPGPSDVSTAESCANSSSSTSAWSSGKHEELDLCGEVCPYTFVYTRLRLEKMAVGAHLVVLVDHEPATRNIPRSARAWGQDVISVEATQSDEDRPGRERWRIVLRKRVC